MHLCFCAYAAEMLFGKFNELYVISEILLLLFVTNLSFLQQGDLFCCKNGCLEVVFIISVVIKKLLVYLVIALTPNAVNTVVITVATIFRMVAQRGFLGWG